MNTPDYNDDWHTSSESSNIKDLNRNSRVSNFVDRTHSLHVFYLIAGSCQVLLGLAVIASSVLGLIEPRWLSTMLIMGASVTTMIGLYLLYITISKSQNDKSLLRNAMRRVMESKN
jgi:hypothetical protein